MDTIVLLSGGLDSFIVAAMAKENSHKIYGLTFNYHQANSKEIEYAKEIAEYFRFDEHFILEIDFGDWGRKYFKTSLVLDSAEKGSAYVPSRNLIFLAYAASMAESLPAQAIALGISATDYSVLAAQHGCFPDCHPDFLKAFQAVVASISPEPIKIFAPLINVTKDTMIQYGKQKDLDFRKTWSCYTNQPNPCGECLACKNRIMGFYKAGCEDPLSYPKDFSQLAAAIKAEWKI